MKEKGDKLEFNRIKNVNKGATKEVISECKRQLMFLDPNDKKRKNEVKKELLLAEAFYKAFTDRH